MKKELTIAIASALLCACGQKSSTVPSYDSLTAGNHPRLFASDKDFIELKKQVETGDNEALCLIHGNTMNLAENHGLSADTLIYRKDASGKRLLAVSREAITRIFSAAYAYRFTGDNKYLHHAEWDINTVCAFKDWNPSHYLDCAEMAVAVAVGYDWLYNSLQDSTKSNALSALKEKAFGTFSKDMHWYDARNNWNQVCHAGLVCAALAIYENDPGFCKALIENSVEANRPTADVVYAPYGAYPEGPVYWNYGTMFQTLMMSELETTLGTDFGLSGSEGFDRTGIFECFTIGNTGKIFNYADNLPKRIPNYPLWYLAWRFDCPQILYKEVEMLRSQPYVDIEVERLLPLYVIYASKIDPGRIKALNELTFFSNGSIPLAMVRTGWEKDDLYLGTKGGFASTNHGHADAGEFVFDAYGVRWASDPGRQEYQDLELQCKQMGGDLWDNGQESVRWKLFRYNNHAHNTLTVNDKTHDVNAHVEMTATFDEPARIGAAFDLTPLFGSDLAKALREVSIRNGNSLEIIDSLKGGSRDASVRWTLVGEGVPEVTPGGIILTADGKKMLLEVKGADVEYHIWPSDPAECGWETAWFDGPIPEHICGFSLVVPAGKGVALTTTLKRIQ